MTIFCIVHAIQMSDFTPSENYSSYATDFETW